MLSNQLTDLGFERRKIVVRAARKDGEVDVPEVSILVRGISAEDVMRLINIHGSALVKLFEQVETGKIELDLANLEQIAGLVMRQAPDLVADLIVIACDEEDVLKGFETAKRLPIPVQMNTLAAILELTFVDGGSLGELIGTVTKMMSRTTGLVKILSATKGSQAG